MSNIDFDTLFSDLEGDFDAVPTTESKGFYAKTEQFPCSACAGTGKYTGVRVHQDRTDCFTCRGKGYFLTSAADRAKASKQRHNRKAIKLEATSRDGVAQIVAAIGPEGFAWLTSATWSSFYQDLLSKAKKYGSLSEKQLACVVNAYAKQQERNTARSEHALFDTALNNGLAKPKLVFGAIKLSLAPASGKNGGCLYVKDDGDYAGKITTEGKFFGLRESRKEILAELQVIAEDPKAAAVQHGQATGNCACCNRLLTNAESIKIGIGPICLENWGL
jgi:DnaJ-class molecular chaperone